MIKLLSLADLSGLADLAQGDGIIWYIRNWDGKKGDYLKLNEIVAHGPSMSVIMRGIKTPQLQVLEVL